MNTCHTCITIPIKSPDKRFENCLKALESQDYNQAICVLLISSGHDNNFVMPLVNTYQKSLNIVFKQISSVDFQHGKTRNIASSLVQATYYVFITQDAVPANNFWLCELVKPLDEDLRVAGSYSRHIAHPDHNQFCRHELGNFFHRLSPYSIVDLNTLNAASSQEEVDLMTFFSNNSSCIRGSLFTTCLPFPEVDFAEDQAWSIAAIKAGYIKAFCYQSVIHHSHNLSVRQAFGRGLDEAMSFRLNQSRRIMGRNPINIAISTFFLCSRDVLTIYTSSKKVYLRRLRGLPRQFLKRLSQSIGIYVGASQRLSKMLISFSRDKALNNSTH